MATSGWITRARIARRLSNTGTNELFLSELDLMSDYASRVIRFRDNAAVDARTVAVNGDIERYWYDALINIDKDFAHITWQSIAQIKMWYDLLSDGGTIESPKKILSYMHLPCSFILEMMADRTKELYFINNNDLLFFEQCFLPYNDVSQYGDIRYSSVDIQDIEGGLLNGYFDVVRATGFGIQKITTDTLYSLMSSVKPGGSFVLSDSSDFGDMYTDPIKEFSLTAWDNGKLICERDDFISYHLPYDVGLTVAKRVA
jgi:hypothetical protein